MFSSSTRRSNQTRYYQLILTFPTRRIEQLRMRLCCWAKRCGYHFAEGLDRSARLHELRLIPRAYQLVPLLMALRQQTVRLMIADDVGIGKTIEAGLVLRELVDRGQIDRFAVLCPPHLVEQWTGELHSKSDLDAVAVTAASAARLERGLAQSQTLFEANPFTVVSLDYIKAEKRRDSFGRACPPFVIVDEAHSCVGAHLGRQQRFELLRKIAEDPNRHLLLLTATPHSGDEQAFSRLLSLLDPRFSSSSLEDEAPADDWPGMLSSGAVSISGAKIGAKIAPSRHDTTQPKSPIASILRTRLFMTLFWTIV